MKLNNFILKEDEIQIKTKRVLKDSITREFTDFVMDEVEDGFIYKLEAKPNMSFAIRALLAKYDVFSASEEVLEVLREKTALATMPVLSLYSTGRHVEIKCPPLNYYISFTEAVGAANKGMNTYTVPIARAFDVIRATRSSVSYLPDFIIDKSLRDELSKPLNGFDGTIASIFNISLNELHAAKRAYRVKEENFNNMGYESVADFLVTQPRRYIDKTEITSHDSLKYKEQVTLIGKIVDKRLVYFKHAVFDIQVGNVIFESIFYQRSWMEKKFSIGEEVLIMGDYQGRGKISGGSLESLVEAQSLDIVPIYPQSAKNNINSKIIMNVVDEAMARIEPHVEKLTPYIDPNEVDMSLGKAIKEMHFPSSSESYIGALETLALYELIYLQLMIIDRKVNEVKDKGLPKPHVKNGYFDIMIDNLPWSLTSAQNEGLKRMNEYMSTETSEQVLLSADVGAGKSVIAQLSCMQALDNGYQSVLAAPTQVLATQLYDTFNNAIELMPEDMRPTLAFLGGKMKAAERRDILSGIESGETDIIIGTHAVFNENIKYKNLGLVVVDEQQKFGAKQRESLLSVRDDNKKPDLLAQTATPIPRSTAQAFYGDIDLISLKGKPKGRVEIKTEWIKEDPKKITKDKNHNLWKDVKKEVDKGYQVFVVVPMVHETTKMNAASVNGAFNDLKETLSDLNVDKTHGSLNEKSQERAMNKFRNGKTDVLVASTVVEVGVDVPNATRMIVLSAGRLGASSLHQVRGRVGRSNLPSTCYLVDEGETLSSQSRLQALVDTTDGFEIAKVDLETRGQGDLFGLRQAGDSDTLRFSNLVDHSKLVFKAQKIANAIYKTNMKDVAISDAKTILGEEEVDIL